ncbi:MAG: CsgG/HfaB family protein [Sedimentisphaerales bacterium]|jgi:TolB-like protein
MKTICALFAITVVFCSLTFAEDTILKQVQGQGPTKDDAIKNGLFQAVAQAKGVKVGSGKYYFGYQGVTADVDRTPTGKSIGVDAVSVEAAGTLNKTEIAGLVKTYEIIDEKKLDDGTYQVTLKVWVYDHKPVDKTSRLRLAVMPLKAEERSYSFINLTMPGDQLADKLSQKITTALTQTNKFAILDRQHIDEYLHERKALNPYDAPIEEQARMGQVLGADYMLVGTITEANLRIKHSTSEAAAGVNFKEYRADFAFDYRVIVASSRQVKFSDSVRLRLETDEVKQLVTKWEPPDLDYRELVDNLVAKAAAEVVNKLSDRLNPPRITSIAADGNVIIDQGGDRLVTGTLLDVFKADKQITDADTNEIIGSTEILVATIRIDKVAPAMSYCSLVSGDTSKLSQGLVCRPKLLPAGEPEGMKSNIERTPQGGVKLPFDK